MSEGDNVGNDNAGNAGNDTPTPPADPTALWPARWKGGELFWIAALMFSAWGSAIGLLATQFRAADWFTPESDVANGPMAFALLAIGLLLLFAGCFFVIYESKKPPEQNQGIRNAAVVDPADLLKRDCRMIR